MSAQRLNAKSIRRIQEATGQGIEFAVGFGGYTFEFVTWLDEHGWYDKKTGEWGWCDPQEHFSSCRDMLLEGT